LIRLQFVGENDIASRIIGAFSAGHLSHVDAIWGTGGLLGARSDNPDGAGKGVQIRRPEYEKFARRVIATIPCTPDQEAAWTSFLTQQIGKPYDWRAIWAFAFNRNWQEEDSYICSELQAAALMKAQIVPPLYLAANKVVPVSLVLAVSALPNVTLEIQ
jgi:uncharacterized protein YycO